MARGRKGLKRRGCGCGVLVILLLLALAGGAAALTWWRLLRPYQGYAGAEKTVVVAPGTAAKQILAQLAAEGVLADATLARLYLIYVLHDRPLQAGEYLFRGPLTGPQVLSKLVRGDVINRPVTLIEGLSLEEAADRLVAAGLGRREVFLDLMRSPELIADLDPQAPDLEGYLFPETYSFPRDLAERTVVATVVRTFRARFERQVRPLLGRQPGRSVRQVVTLASIVEKEAKMPQERPLIAGVYSNRLARGIGLAADPTVIYALKKRGTWDGNIRKDDLRIDSPYNTYRYAGLPPGPICSPGLASLVAAADPADVPYLYFVSRNDGTHVFATTLGEHNRNVDTWQRRYWRDKRARERAQSPGR